MKYKIKENRKLRRIEKLTDKPAADMLRSSCLLKQEVDSEAHVTEVVSLIMEANVTKHKYLHIRVFVTLNLISDFFIVTKKYWLKSKISYPPSDAITVTESTAEVDLPSLLDNTASQIIDLEAYKIYNFCRSLKWGFDGRTGHSEYKQIQKKNILEDNCLFLTFYVPFKIIIKATDF